MIEHTGEHHDIEPVLAQSLRYRRAVRYIETATMFDLMLISQRLPGQLKLGVLFDDIGHDDRCCPSFLQYEGHQAIHGADVERMLPLQIDMFEKGINAE